MANFLMQGLLDHSSRHVLLWDHESSPKTNLIFHLTEGKVESETYLEVRRTRISKSSHCAGETFRELLIDSTKIRLRSDVKTGLFLSGGLDSSSLAVAAQQAGAQELETYSVVSDEQRFSEERYIDVVNQSLGLKGIKFRFQVPHVEEALLQALHHSDEPFGSLSVVALYRMFPAIKANSDVTVLLSGQGGDEVLLGYLKFFFFHLRDLLRKRRYGTALKRIASSAIRGTGRIRQFRLSEAKRYIPWLITKNGRTLRHSYDAVPVWAGKGDAIETDCRH